MVRHCATACALSEGYNYNYSYVKRSTMHIYLQSNNAVAEEQANRPGFVLLLMHNTATTYQGTTVGLSCRLP